MTAMVKTLRSRVLLASVVAALAGTAAHADVTMQERITLGGSGMMQMANMSGTTTTTIAGNRARTESNMQFESAMMRTMARGAGQTAEIVQLDQDRIITLNLQKKTYTETTFAERRAQMQQAMEQMSKAQGSQQQATSGVDESQCEWSDPKSEVKKTGEKAQIGGLQAERVTITATQSCKDKKTGQVCDFGLAFDQWIAPGFEASSETTAYQRAYAEKLGLGTASSRDFAERAQSMFGRYQGIWTEIGNKMREVNIKGHPVKTTFGLGVGGPQCQSVQQTQAAGGPQSPPSIGGALGGALGGMFRKKDPAQPAAADTQPQTMPGGLMPLMTMSTELVSISRDKVDPQAFETPADYKKVQN